MYSLDRQPFVLNILPSLQHCSRTNVVRDLEFTGFFGCLESAFHVNQIVVAAGFEDAGKYHRAVTGIANDVGGFVFRYA